MKAVVRALFGNIVRNSKYRREVINAIRGNNRIKWMRDNAYHFVLGKDNYTLLKSHKVKNLELINESKNQNNDYSINDIDVSYTFKENKLVNIRWEFIDANEKHTWPIHTNSCCLWCCHKFDTIPVSLPKYFYDGKFYHSPAYEVYCRDTTGAGDVFHAAFIRALFEDWDLKSCLDFSNVVAALKCRDLGGRAALPCFDEVLEFMAKGRRRKV